MSKKCIIYYGTVVNDLSVGAVWSWTKQGSHIEEPLPLAKEGMVLAGKPPEYCCEAFEEAKKGFGFYFFGGSTEIRIHLAAIMMEDKPIHFCPFCGAEIVLVEDLKLNAVKATRVVTDYHYEKVTLEINSVLTTS